MTLSFVNRVLFPSGRECRRRVRNAADDSPQPLNRPHPAPCRANHPSSGAARHLLPRGEGQAGRRWHTSQCHGFPLSLRERVPKAGEGCFRRLAAAPPTGHTGSLPHQPSLIRRCAPHSPQGRWASGATLAHTPKSPRHAMAFPSPSGRGCRRRVRDVSDDSPQCASSLSHPTPPTGRPGTRSAAARSPAPQHRRSPRSASTG